MCTHESTVPFSTCCLHTFLSSKGARRRNLCTSTTADVGEQSKEYVQAHQSLHPSWYQMCVCVSPNKSVEVLLFVLDGSTSDAPAVVYKDAQEMEGRQHAGSSHCMS